jgi:hypothetical protein
MEVNFFDYVQLVHNGWFPDPPNGDWKGIREALVNLEKVARACQLTGPNEEADRLKEYIEAMDEKFKEVADGSNVE